MTHLTSYIFPDDVQGYVEYAEVDDPQYFSPERKGWYSYIKDQVGTIMRVYKHETKQTVNTRTYDTFGNLISQTGSSSGNLGFQSKYFDQESGLNYYYHRYYYPSIGRFISKDPMGLSCGLNLYEFLKNNPVISIDPFGLFCIPWFKESTKWYFEKYKWDKPNISLVGISINPTGVAICLWKRASFGYKERLARKRLLCFEEVCGVWLTYFRYGEWKEERKEGVYEFETRGTIGFAPSTTDITQSGLICCPNPWPPFDMQCGEPRKY